MTLPAPYYKDDLVTLYHGDALEIIPFLGMVDLVLADPPYGINTKSDGAGKLSPWADLCNAALFYREWIGASRQLLPDTGALWTFLNWRSLPTFMKAAADLRWPITSLLVWDKEWIGPGGVQGLRPSYELIALYTQPGFSIPDRSVPDIKRCQWTATKPTGHPAEKPLELVKWMIGLSSPRSILDPFAGSGTTLRAAKDLGIRATGIELDAQFCAMAAERLSQEILL